MKTICSCWKCKEAGKVFVDRFTFLSDIKASGLLPSYVQSEHDLEKVKFECEYEVIGVKWSASPVEAWLNPWAEQQISFGPKNAFRGDSMVSMGGGLGHI